MKRSKGEKIFSVINYIFMLAIAFITLYPFLYVLSASISDANRVILGDVLLFPKGVTLDAYRIVLNSDGIWTAYANTVFYTVVGTLVSLLVTICGAYPLSKKHLRGSKLFNIFVTLTMWFHVGIIPTFLNIKGLNLLNTRTGIIVAFACSTFYVILMRTYFQSIPQSIEESAKIDGANDVMILMKIVLPLSVPAIATIGLYYAVSRWNGYFWAMILLNDESKIPLQVLLKKLIVELNLGNEMMGHTDVISQSQETITYATIMISIIPIIAVYPYIQKYFIKGMMVGAVKE